MTTRPSPTLAARLRRAVSPSFGARANAAEALRDFALEGDPLARNGNDLASFRSHRSGLSHRRATGRLASVLWEVFPGQVALLDRDGVVVSVNRAWREFGLHRGGSATAGLGANYLALCDRAVAEGERDAAEAMRLVQTALAGDDPDESLAYSWGSGDEQRWFRLQAVPVPGQHSGALVVHTDVTDDRQREREWQHRAFHDALTGLPNRALLRDRLDRAVVVAARDPGSVAVMFIDLDDFKSINDSHGHAGGDEVLCEAGRRMAGSVRSADTLGRWGGDEFLVIAERLDPSTTADGLVLRITQSLGEAIPVGAARVSVTATVGVVHPQPGQSAESVVSAADQALHHVRQLRGHVSRRAASGG